MPELPEVETIRIGLSGLLPGRRIADVRYDWPKSFPNSEEDTKQFLVNATILDVRRRAKVLLIDLDSAYTLVIHLKMTGQLVYVGTQGLPVASRQSLVRTKDKQAASSYTLEQRFGAGHPNDSLIGDLPDKSTRVIFTFTDASQLFFNDQRKFGWVRLLPTAEVPNIDFFKKVGPEPLGAEFTSSNFRNCIRRRPRSCIKAVLLDQTIVAGIGNIYADESLWAAKIHPTTLVDTISTPRLNRLYEELRTVLLLAIEKGGSTDKNYVNAEGKKGSYLLFASVFRREGQACPRCGATIIKLRVAGRGTHICPKCQKAAL